MLFVRRLLFLILLSVTNVTSASTGRITDAATGNPIAGATVYVVWYYHPLSIAIFEGQHPADKLCDGSTVAVTDVNGYYTLPPGIAFKTTTHEAHQFVFAPGYYNNWEGPAAEDEHDFAQLLRELSWDTTSAQKDAWSKRLTPFGSASIDTKLLVLTSAARRIEPLCNAHNDDQYLAQLRVAAAREMKNVICEASRLRQAPRTDVFKRAFGGMVDQRLLPRHNRAIVPTDLVDEACVKMREKF